MSVTLRWLAAYLRQDAHRIAVAIRQFRNVGATPKQADDCSVFRLRDARLDLWPTLASPI